MTRRGLLLSQRRPEVLPGHKVHPDVFRIGQDLGVRPLHGHKTQQRPLLPVQRKYRGVAAVLHGGQQQYRLPETSGAEPMGVHKIQLGDIDDLSAPEAEYEAGANQYIGKANGMDDEIVVRVTMDGDKIADVEVLHQNETPGIGVPAIEQLPEQFIGLDSEEAINGVDGLSGATITSNALKQAVVNALLQAKG